MAKEAAPPGSIPYSDFLAAVKDKKVEGVVFEPPSGDVAYAIIDGKSVRVVRDGLSKSQTLGRRPRGSFAFWRTRTFPTHGISTSRPRIRSELRASTSRTRPPIPRGISVAGPRGARACSRKCMVELKQRSRDQTPTITPATSSKCMGMASRSMRGRGPKTHADFAHAVERLERGAGEPTSLRFARERRHLALFRTLRLRHGLRLSVLVPRCPSCMCGIEVVVKYT